MADEPEKSPEDGERPEELDDDIRALRERFGDGVLGAAMHRGQLSAEIAPSALAGAAVFLRDARGFKLLTFIAGVDWLELPTPFRFKAVYGLLDLGRAKRLRLEVPCEDDIEPRLPSVCGVWPTASSHESEAYDMVGIVFGGNDNMERILTPEGFEGHPHRKDFDINSEPVAFSFRGTPEGKPEAAE